MNDKHEYPTLTVGEMKKQLSTLPDNCVIHFSPTMGHPPTFSRFKNWAYDKNDTPTEVVLEFNEPA